MTKEDAGVYELPLEMVRQAPSAVNRQPWRVVMRDGAERPFRKNGCLGYRTCREHDLYRILGSGIKQAAALTLTGKNDTI